MTVAGDDAMSEGAMAYRVWRVDCSVCSEVIDYGEDESTLPDACEHCGAGIERSQ